ncbi:MAG: hypothetical protein IKI30_02650 [Oxalobacter sp.]|nr:hypothetical protein [Oxalobacter sp.]
MKDLLLKMAKHHLEPERYYRKDESYGDFVESTYQKGEQALLKKQFSHLIDFFRLQKIVGIKLDLEDKLQKYNQVLEKYPEIRKEIDDLIYGEKGRLERLDISSIEETEKIFETLRRTELVRNDARKTINRSRGGKKKNENEGFVDKKLKFNQAACSFFNKNPPGDRGNKENFVQTMITQLGISDEAARGWLRLFLSQKFHVSA